MTSQDLASYFTSGDLYLVFAAISFLIVRALDRWTPDTMFTTPRSKLIANGVISVVTPVLVALPNGLIAHMSPTKLIEASLFAFFGSTAFNTWIPMKPKAKDVEAGQDPTKLEAARKVVNAAIDQKTVKLDVVADPPKGAARRRFNGLAVPLFGGLVLGVAFLMSCTAQQGAAVVSAIPTIARDVCDVAESQPEPAWVTLACTAFDAKGNEVRKYSATIPKAKMAACPKTDGKVAP